MSLATDGFDALVTVDRNLACQQNVKARPVAVVVLDATSVKVSALLRPIPRSESAQTTLQPQTLVRITAA